MRTHALLRLSALGDIVLCSSIVRELQTLWPQDDILFITRSEFAGFVRSTFPGNVRVLGLDRPWGGLLGWFFLGWSSLRQMSAPGTELLFYDLHSVSKSRAFYAGLRAATLLSKTPFSHRRIAKRSLLRWFSVLLGRDLIGPRHLFREHLKLVPQALTTLDPSSLTPQLKTSGISAEDRAGRLLIAPDASRWKKLWPAGHWEQFIHTALAHPQVRSVTLVGGARCLPQDFRDDLDQRYGDRVKDLLGKTTLEELPSIAAHHAVTVCSNSAWLHVSEAAGTPVVTLAGPIVPGFGFSPWKKESRELSVELDCRPCSRHGGGVCRKVGKEFHACMRRISPQDVWAATEKVMFS